MKFTDFWSKLGWLAIMAVASMSWWQLRETAKDVTEIKVVVATLAEKASADSVRLESHAMKLQALAEKIIDDATRITVLEQTCQRKRN